MTGSGYKKGTEKHMGNPTFLLYMNCPRVIDEFTVELPEERIDLNYHEINNLFPLISPVGTYCPCHRATQASEKANPQGDIGKHLFPFFFGRRWYGRKKKVQGIQADTAYSKLGLADTKRTTHCSLYLFPYVARNESLPKT